MYAQDFLIDLDQLQWLMANLRAKGMKGAVGTAASYAFLLHDQCMSPSELEGHTLQNFNIASFPITSQTYPRKQDTLILNTLAGIAQSAYRFAFDLRILQSPGFGELSEPFSANQVGSSAMPFKRNPRTTERVCSLTRYIMALPAVAYGNAAHSLLERTLDDSAARRLMFPEAFLGLDESLIGLRYVTSHINIHREAIRRNLERFGPFAGTERLLMAWVRNRGFNRQDLHEIIREASLEAWKTIEAGQPNPLVDLITLRALANSHIHENYATLHDEVDRFLNPSQHIGIAPERARQVASEIRHKIAELASSTASPAEPPAF
jgi:adenylosuccinate lyase